MSSNSGMLQFTAAINNVDFNRVLADMENRIKGFSDKSAEKVSALDQVFKKLGDLARIPLNPENIQELITNIVRVRGEVAQLENAFTGLLKSKSGASELMRDIIKTAAETPFDLTEIANGARQLLAYGADSRSVMTDIKMLGDVASGVAMPINDLIELYGTLKNTGKASTGDLETLAAKGIPIYNELGKVLNIGVNRVKEFAEAGRISFNDVQKAFAGMTANGGILGGMMAQQSQTLTGLVGNFKDALDEMFNEMGESQEGLLASGISMATSLVKNYDTVIDALAVLTIAYGAYKAAVILPNAIANVTAFVSLAASIRSASEAQVLFNLVSSANPIALLIAGLAAAAAAFYFFSDSVDAATAAKEKFNETQEKDKQMKDELIGKTQSLINTIRNETSSKFQQIEAFKELQKLYPELFNSMTVDNFKKKEAAAIQRDLNKALDEMSIAKVEKDLQEANAKVKLLTDNLKRFNETPLEPKSTDVDSDDISRELEKAKVLVEENTNKLRQLKEIAEEANTPAKEQVEHYEKIKANLEKSIENIRGTVSPLKQTGKEANVMKKIFEQIRLTALLKDLDETNVKLDKARDKLRNEKDTKFSESLDNAKSAKDLRALRGEANTNNRKESLVEKTKSMLDSTETNDPERNRLAILYKNLTEQKKEVAPFGSLKYWEEALKKAKDALSLVTKPESKRAEDLMNKRLEAEFKIADLKLKLDKNYADGSIESYEKIAQSAADLLSKISPFDPKYGETMKTEKDNREQAENLRKALAVKTTDEEIEEKKKQYELYNLWLKHAGKEAADEQFKNLKGSGASFAEYLETNINTIQGRVDNKTATSLDLENLVKYKTAFESINQNIDDYKQKITSAGQAVGSLTEYLRLLKEEQVKLGKNDDGKKGFLAEQVIETEKKRRDLLKSFFIENNLGEEKRLGIQKKYDDLRAELDREYADKKSRIYQEALDKINLQEQNELNEADGYFKDIAEKTLKELSAIIEKKSRNKLKQFINSAYTDLTEMQMAGKTGTEAYKKMEKAIDDAKKKLEELDTASMKEMISIVEQTGSQLKGLGGQLGEVGNILEDLGHQAQSVFATIEKAKDPGFEPGMKDYASAIQGVVNMISIVIEANKKRAEQEKKFAQERIGYENQYQLALNKGIGGKYKKDGNVFFDDIEAKIKAGAKQLQDAQRTYQDAINKLNSGWAKDHQKDVIDGKTVGKLIGQGAAVGAVIGSIIPGPGNAIGAAVGAVVGAVVGGITGLFTKKKKDVFGGLLELYPSLVETGADGWKEINVEMANALLANDQLDDGTKQLVQSALDYGEAVNQSTEQIKEGILELVGKLGDTVRDSLVNAFKAGEDAAMAFSRTVGNVIADMAAKLLFAALFKDNFDKLEKEMMESYGVTGDQSIVDDLSRFTKDAEGKPKKFVEDLQSISDALEGMGFQDVFGKKGASGSNGLSGSIKSVTEETAGVLAGQLNAIRINQATNLEVNRSQLLSLTKIANNSEYLKHLELLKSIDKKLSTSNDLRAGGIDPY